MSEAMNVQAENLEKLNNLYVMQSLLINMETNIYLIEQGSAGEVIQVSNANLFQLAAKYYGDATKWTAIAEANGLTDPVVQPTLTASLDPNFSSILIIGGFVSPYQSIVVTITTETYGQITYTYNVLITDTLTSIAQNIANLIPGATATENQINLPAYSAIQFQVLLFLNLIIPQSAPNQGGILQS